MKKGMLLMWLGIICMLIAIEMAERGNIFHIIPYLITCAILGFLAGAYDK